MEKVKETTSKTWASAPPQAGEQPKLPAEMKGPQMLSCSSAIKGHSQPDGMPHTARASELLASPEGDLGAPTRARIASMLQRQVGNARMGWALGGSLQAKRTVGAHNDVQEQEADQLASAVGKTSAAKMIQRQPAGRSTPAAPAPTPSSVPALTPNDELVTASLLQTLERFKNIPIFVGFKPLPPDFIGPSEPVIVNVHAQYYNNKYNEDVKYNKSEERDDYPTRRGKQKFSKIIKELEKRGVMSVLEAEGNIRRSAGRAVQVGKASPEDIKAFVEEAIAQGIIEDYARSPRAHRKLKKGEKLVDLPRDDLQKLIQGWMRYTGVGLDCNGFVQQALIQVREDERAMPTLINSIAGAFGLPALSMPEAIERTDIWVGGFKTKEIVKHPTILRPGDVWVSHDEGHIRIVTSVRPAKTKEGVPTIEFDTAESTVSSNLDPGPVARTWQTGSLTSFKPITRNGHKADEGTFHHIPASKSLTSKKGRRGRTSRQTP